MQQENVEGLRLADKISTLLSRKHLSRPRNHIAKNTNLRKHLLIQSA